MAEQKTTDEELNNAWDNAFETPMNFDHEPTPEELFTIRLRAVADEADSKWVSVLKKYKMTVDSPESLALAVDLLIAEAVKAKLAEIEKDNRRVRE